MSRDISLKEQYNKLCSFLGTKTEGPFPTLRTGAQYKQAERFILCNLYLLRSLALLAISLLRTKIEGHRRRTFDVYFIHLQL